MRIRRILASLLAASMLLGQAEPVWAAGLPSYENSGEEEPSGQTAGEADAEDESTGIDVSGTAAGNESAAESESGGESGEASGNVSGGASGAESGTGSGNGSESGETSGNISGGTAGTGAGTESESESGESGTAFGIESESESGESGTASGTGSENGGAVAGSGADEAGETAEAYEEIDSLPSIVTEDSFSANVPSPAGLSAESAEWEGSFGAQLAEGAAKELYEGLKKGFLDEGYYAQEPSAPLTVEATLETPITFTASIKDGNVIEENDSYLAACDEANRAFQQAWAAFYQDYPQVYWIYQIRCGYKLYASGTEGTISDFTFTVGKQYYDGCSIGQTGDPTLQAYQEAIGRIADEAREAAGDDRFALLKYLHDDLCETLTYHTEAAEAQDASDYLYAHTSVSALVGYESAHEVVCEGYAKAFKALCDELEIPCVLVSGMGGTDGASMGAHMWNYVQMEDERWYLVDVTWDDQEDSGIYYEYFLAGSGSEGFAGGDLATVGEQHLAQSVAAGSGDFAFAYPELSETAYEPQEETDDRISLGDAYADGTLTVDYAKLWTWTGEAVDAAPYGVYLNGAELFPGRDYRIVYEDASGETAEYVKDTGSYTMVLEGIYEYRGEVRLEIQVTKDYALADMTVGAVAAQVYTGGELCPAVKLTNPKTRATLREGTHYTVEYADNVDAGTGRIVVSAVEGKGYTGRIEVTFEIRPCPVTGLALSGLSGSYDYTGLEIRPEFTLKNGSVRLARDTDYTVEYSANVHAGTAKAVIAGTGNYSGERTLTFRIVQAALELSDVTVDTRDLTDGLKPQVTVSRGGETLVKNRDYTVAYAGTSSPRKGTVTVRGTGDYKGTVKLAYTIPRIGLKEEYISFAGTWYETGKAISAVPAKIAVAGRSLNRGTDYTLRYETADGQKLSAVRTAGEYVLVVEGKGDYTGTVRLPFTVSSDRLLGRMDVSGIVEKIYTGGEITQEAFTVKDPGDNLLSALLGLSGGTLKEGTHYTVSYENNVNAGTASIRLTAVAGSGYAGERTVSFRIRPRDISDGEVQAELPATVNYEGEACRPEPALTLNGRTLEKDTDYTVSWTDNEGLGTGAAVISGKGNFTGSRTMAFEIVENTLTPEVSCTLEEGTFTYTGEEIAPKITVTDKESGETLAEGTDYRVAYEDNVNAGEAAVVLYGKGEYSGTYRQSFTIEPKDIGSETIRVEIGNSAAGSDEELAAGVTDGERTLAEGTDYTIACAAGEAQTAVTITGKGNYTGERTETVVRTSLSGDPDAAMTLSYYEILYTGSRMTPVPTVTLGGQTLTEGRDYTVSYRNNLDAGDAGEADAPAVTVQGRGVYAGTLSRTFTIKAVDINRASVGSIASCTYWNASQAEVNLTYRGRRLRASRDYTVSYDGEIRIGTNTVILTGIGNYQGTVELELKVTFTSAMSTKLTACTMLPQGEDTGTMTVRLTVADDGKIEGLDHDNTVLYVQVPGPDGQTQWAEGTLDADAGTVTASFPADTMLRSNLMGRYALAVASGSSQTGYQKITGNDMYVDNPEDFAVTTNTYVGFYEGKTASKKGMQGRDGSMTADLGVQAVLINIPLNEMIRTSANIRINGSAAYQAYTYKGKTYYFHNMISYRRQVLEFNTGKYGAGAKNVSVNLLMGWDPELQYLIHPSARVSGKSYYALNMTDARAKETLEALFCYMTEALGGTSGSAEGSWFDGEGSRGPRHFRASNWILGNEVNACRAWNYAGNLSVQECADNYAKAFQLLYQAVKKSDRNARVFLSLDHSWTAGSSDGHSGKEFLDRFAYYMNATEPQMDWNVNYHPYSQPLTRNDFWNDYSSTTDSEGTAYISMRNLSVLTGYLGKLETRYGKESGSIRVILGEQGYSAANSGQERLQAAAIAYEFYLASMNTRVDAMINRAYIDDAKEGVMKLGLMYENHVQKQSYEVFKYMDQKGALTDSKVIKYASAVRGGASGWTNVLPGLTEVSFLNE
ncbi:MAG: DUF5722 domain-containing protein [Eubacteriales bacterium]|nr:DUF5722 domain-containing protein [Eubacteriales bacterium]